MAKPLKNLHQAFPIIIYNDSITLRTIEGGCKMSSPNIIQSLLDFLQRLLGQGPLAPGPLPQADELPDGTPAPVKRKVSLLIFDPIITTQGGRRLSHVMGWNDPNRMVADLIMDLCEISNGYTNFEIVEHILVNEFPIKADGFAYTGEEYLHCWRKGSGFHQPDAVDYERIISDYQLAEKVKSGAIDEVWTIGFPYAGFYESRMAGPDAFWCNAPPIENSQTSGRRYIIMAFNYERGIGEMLESMGHRAESILEHTYRRTSPANNLYKRFIRTHKSHPGQAEVGTVHYAPNSRQDYEWGNSTPVQTSCRSWLKFPDLSDQPVVLDCREWGNGDIRDHHKWWFQRMPHLAGSSNGIYNNWWAYIVDPNLVR